MYTWTYRLMNTNANRPLEGFLDVKLERARDNVPTKRSDDDLQIQVLPRWSIGDLNRLLRWNSPQLKNTGLR